MKRESGPANEELDAAFWEKELERAEGNLKEWRDRTVADLRAKAARKRAGRKPFSAERKRTERVTLCFNAEELERVRNYVGDRETADVLRSLVLDAIDRR